MTFHSNVDFWLMPFFPTRQQQRCFAFAYGFETGKNVPCFAFSPLIFFRGKMILHKNWDKISTLCLGRNRAHDHFVR